MSTCIFEIYFNVMSDLPNPYNAHDLNNHITEIVSEPNYDPNQWVIQYYEFQNQTIVLSPILLYMIRCIDPKHYEAFPTEWWMLAYQHWPSIFKQLIDET